MKEEFRTKVIALIRNGFTLEETNEGLSDIRTIRYRIGDSFPQIWDLASGSDATFVLLVDSAVRLSENSCWLMYQLLQNNPSLDGITMDAAGLSSVYGIPAGNQQRGPYTMQRVSTLPPWLAMIRTASWKGSSMSTPEFFLLDQTPDKKMARLNSQQLEFDTFTWAGDLITGSVNELAADFKKFKGPQEFVPPQFRVMIPGKGNAARQGKEPPMSNPSFSVICPSIRPEFLAEAIESVLYQEYPNWELWIGVDGPKETIRKKIEEVITPYTRDPRIHVLYCEHMGTGPIRRLLSQKAKGDFIVGLDDDDRLMPAALQRFADTVIADPDIIVLRGGIKLFGLVDAHLPARIRYKINGIPNDLFEANQPYAVKRTTLEAIGGLEWDPDLKNSGEDSDFLLKIDREEFKLTVLDEPLYERRLSTYNQTLDCSAEECLQHVHNLYKRHNPSNWSLNNVHLTGNGPKIRMHTLHASPDSLSRVVCSTEFMNFQQVGSRDGVVLDLEITSLCNADCTFCPRTTLDRSNRFMSLENVKRVADSLRHEKMTPTVVLCGIGESTLHPDLLQLLSILSEAGANVCMTTNGWSLSLEYVDQLVAAGLSELNVSLNAATPETHQKVMRLKHFNSIFETCRQIAANRRQRWPSLKFHVSFVLTESNIQEVDLFIDHWKDADVSRIWLHPLTNRAGNISETCKPANVDKLPDRYAGIQKVLVDLWPGNKEIANLCHIAKQVDFISVDGDMLLCAQDYGAGHRFGNIKHDPLDNLHHNKILRHLRGETASTCSKCSFCPEGFKSCESTSYTIVQAKDY